MKKLNILAFYKHNIVYKNIKHKMAKTFLMSVACVLVMGTMFFAVFSNVNFKQVAETVNPINELYRDVQVATFVNAETLNFILPVKSDVIENNNSELVITVTDSIMVIAPASGEITDVSNKSITIKHTDKISTQISGVDICGVKAKQIVKQGKEIATAKQGGKISVKVIENGKVLDGLYVYKSFIKWD